MGADRAQIVVLNYNGRALLRECLPSVVEAAERCPFPCSVSIIDNESTDGSLETLAEDWPGLQVWREPNRGLASFNAVLPRIDEPVVLLLNNDVKLAPSAVEPLVRAVLTDPEALFAAPSCWTFDGAIYEGMRTRVRSRFGIVQGLCRVPGHLDHIGEPGLTASAGPVLAVDRLKFLALGGYDPLFLPGRIEDLDLGFRGWMAGWKGKYVPESLAYHRGFGSFGPAFGQEGCDRLAVRNTFLFTWKNLSGWRLANHLAWLPIRIGHALAAGRPAFLGAFWDAARRIGQTRRARRALAVGVGDWSARQESFFREFQW